MGWWTFFQPASGFPLHLAATQDGICKLSLRTSTREFLSELSRVEGEAGWEQSDNPLLADARAQLTAYFRCELRQFHLPLDLRGTAFQRRVWTELLTIPYGKTSTYARVARAIGAPKAFRAVGSANGANPVAIVVPCHRVLASGGGLGGYGGGPDVKRALLALEAGTVEQPLLYKTE